MTGLYSPEFCVLVEQVDADHRSVLTRVLCSDRTSGC